MAKIAPCLRPWIVLGLILWLGGCTGSGKEELLAEGVELYGKNNYRGAIVLFKNALDQDPSFYQARFLLADAYLQSGRFDIAEREFRKVAHQAPDYPGLPLKLGELYIQLNRPEEAAGAVTPYLQQHPDDPRALRLLGIARALQGELQEAQHHFRRALAIDPQNSEVQRALADLGDVRLGSEIRDLLLQDRRDFRRADFHYPTPFMAS